MKLNKNNIKIQNEVISINLIDANTNYLKVISDYLTNKKLASKQNKHSILIKTNNIEHSLNKLEILLNDFLDIKTVIIDPNAFKNPHEGIAYFNGAKDIIKNKLML